MVQRSAALVLALVAAAATLPFSSGFTRPVTPGLVQPAGRHHGTRVGLPRGTELYAKGSKGLRKQDEMRRKMEQAKQAKDQSSKEAVLKTVVSGGGGGGGGGGVVSASGGSGGFPTPAASSTAGSAKKKPRAANKVNDVDVKPETAGAIAGLVELSGAGASARTSTGTGTGTNASTSTRTGTSTGTSTSTSPGTCRSPRANTGGGGGGVSERKRPKPGTATPSMPHLALDPGHARDLHQQIMALSATLSAINGANVSGGDGGGGDRGGGLALNGMALETLLDGSSRIPLEDMDEVQVSG